jgi:hypothetical protein
MGVIQAFDRGSSRGRTRWLDLQLRSGGGQLCWAMTLWNALPPLEVCTWQPQPPGHVALVTVI